jgi:hypothetical protein
MARSSNPQSKVLAQAQAAVAAAQNIAGVGAEGAGTAAAKAALDKTTSMLGAGLDSPLNGITGGGRFNVEGGFGQLSSTGGVNAAAQTLVGGVTGALNNAGQAAGTVSNIASGVAGAIDKLTAGAASSGGIGSGLAALAGKISAAAGQLNNILSLSRAKKLPSGAELFKSSATVQIVAAEEGDWRVRVACDFDTLFGKGTFSRLVSTKGMVFPFTPNLSFTSKANYTVTEPVHSNFPFQSYKNSQVEDITISGEFPAEKQTDGLYWLEATMFLRTATKMFYGQGAFAGNPPVVCRLTGYGPMIFNNVPVVIKSFTIDLKDDVNYINVPKDGTENWVPVLSTISITLSPVYNRERLRKFSLQNFAAGKEIGII